MKKWEEQQKNKVHQSRIKNVKAAVSNTGVRKSGKLNKSLNDSRQISQIKSPAQQGVVNENQNSISDYYESEKTNLQSIPLYRILKLQNLQQYAKELISRGYGYDLRKFNYLSQQQLDSLLNEIRFIIICALNGSIYLYNYQKQKVLPGHKVKLIDLLDLISNEMIPEIENNSMWNAYSPGGSGQVYNPTLQSSGKSLNKANSAKFISAKQHFQAIGGRQPATTKSSGTGKSQNMVPNLQRKNSQPHVSTNNRNNHHMYYQGNQRQIKSHTSHIKKRSGQNIGYDYFMDSQDENDGYDEFQEAIEGLVNQYNFANNRQMYKNKEQTDESFKNELHELDLEFELEQNIGYKNHQQMRAKLDKAISQANKQPSKTQTNYSSGNSISSNNASTKNPSFASSKTNPTSQTISGSSISQRQTINQSTSSQAASLKQSTQQTTAKDTQAKPSSSHLQRRPSSGISKPGTQQSSTSTQASKESKEVTNPRGSSNIQQGVSSLKQQEKEQPKPVKKESQISQTAKQQEEGKGQKLQKEKEFDSKQKQEIEKLRQKLEASKGLASTTKDLASQLQKQESVQQNQSGLQKKGRPQTAKYQRTVQYVQDDQYLIPEYDENDKIILNYKENRLVKNLMKNTKSKNDNADELNPQLDYDTIKHMYMSFDGGRLTSTIVNLDIEEMCFCFSCAIVKHIEHGEEVDKANQNNKMLNNLHQIDEEHEDHASKEQNSSKKVYKQDSYTDNSACLDDNSAYYPYDNAPQSHNHPNQCIQQQNDNSLNRTTNPIEEPTMIHDDYNQSIINADAERYLKDDDQEYRSAERQFPQQFPSNNGEYNWKQKKSLSDISERTHEVSHQNNKSLTVDQSNEQSLNLRNNLTNANSRKQFEQSRHEIEEILKESLLMNVRDNQSLRRRLEVDNHDDEKEFEYTENEDEDDDHQEMQHLKKKGLNSKQDVRISKIPFEESLNQYQNLEKNPNSEDEDNEFISKTLIKDTQNKKQKQNKTDLDDSQNQDQSLQEPASNNQNYNDFSDNLYEVESEGEVEIEQQPEQEEAIQQEGAEGESQLNFSTISRYSIVIPNDENSNKRLFDKTFNYKENTDQIFTQKPTKETIQNYCKNVCISCQLEKQIPIIALVYIERLLNNSGFTITPKNWRKITITSMIMASKIWDDESFENKNFSQAFPIFDVIQINEMERVFLNFIDYNLYVKGADYAKYYFILREFAQKNKKSFPLRPLDLKTILFLQNNANRAQSNLKEMYQNPLNKSF